MLPDQKQTITQLQSQILRIQGYRAPGRSGEAGSFDLGPLEGAFPGGVFPSGALHEFVCEHREGAAATAGFASALLARLMNGGGTCLWISQNPRASPSGLARFGVHAERVIFVNLARTSDVLWATAEALACTGLAAVVAEVPKLDFAASRKLQLAAGCSGVTGLVFLSEAYRASACAARWQITPLASGAEQGMPGVGHPRWRAELLKVRNGQPGVFQLEWRAGTFVPLAEPGVSEQELQQQEMRESEPLESQIRQAELPERAQQAFTRKAG